MIRKPIPISILYSTTGTYAALGRDAVDGALAAIAEVNSDPGCFFQFEPRVDDPAGNAERYAELAGSAIRQRGCRHIVGAITSWSRKEVLPVVERHGALLWYAFPHEGYETSDSVIYLGACPNQHLLPLFDYVLPRYGRRPFIVGSNYIWGWEIGRIAREITGAAGGEVLAERFVPLGSEEVDHLIAEIRLKRPDFILSNLVGRSAHAFIRTYAELREEDVDFSAEHRPLVACNLSEIDLADLSPQAKAGHIVTNIYLDRLDTQENRSFKARLAARRGDGRPVTGPFAFAYMAVSVLAQAIADAGTDDPDLIRRVVTQRRFDMPIGSVSFDPRTHYAGLRPFIGRSDREGGFEIFDTETAVVEADPYLVRSVLPGKPGAHAPGRGLKVVK
ncbi:transporter substrate-binding protein [Rhizobium sp. P40RR-XXII]|uniref:transporter substrate-binding protein n=1 Tax=unclassified Rhizobium TaxID=2613769 RepID=UPI001457605E|nr:MULTISPECIES: transporter substrate-binding protein [unclassified Rhizobium]NLR86807.1 transporter substrate-binding protein [Rhizobium sp. P28RR-XV]NLS17478.1 transporter substrate-binding protein [Rhizobium sp. P40RR-XXII]